MRYEKKLKTRVIVFGFLLMVGVVVFIMGVMVKLSPEIDNFSAGYLTGTGGGLIGGSLVKLLKNITALRNKNKQKSMMIEENDERNLLISYKAGYYSMLTTLMVIYIVCIYFVFNDSIMLKMLSAIIVLMLFFYILIYIILKKFK